MFLPFLDLPKVTINGSKQSMAGWFNKFSEIGQFLDNNIATAWQIRAVSTLVKVPFLLASLAEVEISPNFF